VDSVKNKIYSKKRLFLLFFEEILLYLQEMTAMNAKELGNKLKEMYDNAPRKELVTMIHLFGIKYHNEIELVGTREVVEASGINISYVAEISKALRLAKYVIPR
jgi:hypothetical protein